MTEEKTHYRKVFNSPYLSSADIIAPTVLTIARVVQEINQTKKSKDMFNTAYFVEKEIRPGEVLKPMVLNATNSRIMANLTGSKFIEDWSNIAVTIYVEGGISFGRDTVEGLRISTEKAMVQKKELLQNTPAWKHAITAYRRDGNYDKIEERMTISVDNKILLKEEADAMA